MHSFRVRNGGTSRKSSLRWHYKESPTRLPLVWDDIVKIKKPDLDIDTDSRNLIEISCDRIDH